MDGIHFLKGTGSNCTCSDCSVLYGGTCSTTAENNFLDRIEKVALTLVGTKSYICRWDTTKFLEAIRPIVRKRYKWSNAEYDKQFYVWLPFLYMAVGYKENKDKNYDHSDARLMYKRARSLTFWNIEKALKQ